MIKIAAILAYTPLVHNHSVPNSLMHNLLLNRPKDSELYLYYYPQPIVSAEILQNDIALLKPKQTKEIKITPMASGVKAKLKNAKQRIIKTDNDQLPPIVHQYMPDNDVLDELKQIQPDAIVMFPYWLIHWAKQLHQFNVVVSATDSGSLHFLRAVKAVSWKNANELNSYLSNFQSYIKLETEWGKTNARLQMVGKADMKHLLNVNHQKLNIFYAPHPYNDFIPIQQTLDKVTEKINLLVTGVADSVYFANHFSTFVDLLITNKNLSKHYQLVFIGSGYEDYVIRLTDAGYQITHHKWVEDFSKALAQCQLQLFPLAVGTGTKG